MFLDEKLIFCVHDNSLTVLVLIFVLIIKAPKKKTGFQGVE